MTVEMKVEKQVLTCEEFQEQLPELAASGESLQGLDHLTTCEKCSELVRDLEYIVTQARLLLPLRDPSPVVWDKISEKINSPGKS